MEFLLPSSNRSSTVKSRSPSKTRTKRPRSISKTPSRSNNTRKKTPNAPKKRRSEINRLENDDSLFDLTDISKVGTESVNGTVYIINSKNKYAQKMEDLYRPDQLTNARKSLTKSKSKQKSTGFTYIIKTSQNNKADNLAYEYLVGEWLNQYTSKYDCFLRTYTLYYTDTQTLYQTSKYAKIKNLLENRDKKIKNLAKTYKTTTQDVGEIRSIICGEHTNLLLVQEFVKGRTFYDYLMEKTLSDHDIWCILYQIYYPLSQLVKQDFYHGDLHVKNVLIKEVSSYEKRYNGFKIKCNYRAYMIDYGRSIYPYTYDDLKEVGTDNIQTCGLGYVLYNYQKTGKEKPIVNPDIRLYNSIAPNNKKYSIEAIIKTIQKNLPEVSKKRDNSLSA